MAKINLSSEDFGLKLYDRFPPIYREEDINQKFALKRYLESLSEGGFKHTIDEINGLMTLKDYENNPLNVLIILFQQYGLDLFANIPEMYLRFLFPTLGDIYYKKGSYNVISYITSALSGVITTVDVEYDADENPLLTITLDMDTNITDYFPNSEQLNRILVNYLPFYCDKILIYTYFISDSGEISGKDECSSKLMTLTEDTAVFNHAIMGKAVFNKDDTIDEILSY